MDAGLLDGTARDGPLSNDFYRAVLDSLEEQFALINPEGRILFVNKSWRHFAHDNGLSYDFDWIGHNYLSVCKTATHCGDANVADIAAGLEAVLSGRIEHFYCEYPCHSPSEQRWFIMRVVPVQHPGISCFVVSHQNITQRKLIEQAVEHSAQHDPLTGLANRRRFETFLAKSWRRAQRSVSPLSLLIVDLDNFKLINDSLGHLAGDRALARIAAVLQSCARRETDLAARYGGDEFVLVLRDTDDEGARLVAQQVIEGVAALNVSSSDGVRVGTSIGLVTRVPGQAEDCIDPRTLLRLADDALYQVKGAGGGAWLSA